MYKQDVAPSPRREARQWWAVHDDRVLRVTGYSCAPNAPQSWWCPDIGYTCTEGFHLFKTEAEALDKHIANLERLATETDERLVAFRLQRSPPLTPRTKA